MKKITDFIKNNQGGIVLLLIVYVLTFLTAMLCCGLGLHYTTALITAQNIGIFSIISVSSLFKLCNMQAPMSIEWGIVGLILGLFVSMIVY